MNSDSSKIDPVTHEGDNSVKSSDSTDSTKWFKSQKTFLVILLALTIMIWIPRLKGPIDLRWDGGVYYILGTSLAEGRGYKLLNEPGQIDALQYPPLLPLIVAGYQTILRTSDPTIVGEWLRYSAFIFFIFYIYLVFRFFKSYLALNYAFLATLFCLFTLHVYFLSDLLFPEILFSAATLLFILLSKNENSRFYSGSTYLFAVLSYALRTVGIAAFAAWVLESLVQRRFKQAVLRAFLVLIPIICWQSYIFSVESSDNYRKPAYAYQRAPYMFYNVSYARNVSLMDPFAPEKGDSSPVKIVRRFLHNAIELPVNLGETLAIPRGYFESFSPFGDDARIHFVVSWGIYILLYLLGLLVFGGIALLVLRRQWIVPLYVMLYLAAVCLTPFPGQYLRYLVPTAPLLVLSLVTLLSPMKENSSWHIFPVRSANFKSYLALTIFLIVLLTKTAVFATVYGRDMGKISYLDYNRQPIEYRLFFYDESQQSFDLTIDYLRQAAKADEVVAAGTPHWIYLRTGLKTVMPPFEIDPLREQQMLDSVPVNYLLVGKDVIGAERYTLPVVQQFTSQWKQVFSTPDGEWTVYQRVSQ